MIEYKSSFKIVYMNPKGTSECPVCGDNLGISKCETCGVDYDRLASLAITPRGLRLPVYRECGWPSLKDEYLCTGHEPSRRSWLEGQCHE
ncbi:MAG: hypothetical protein QXG99_06670 [Conexivisphaerales archaeon]